jgi:lipopolysaccharide/colanic/teichoic acid biosynthesis glycosyltransferase
MDVRAEKALVAISSEPEALHASGVSRLARCTDVVLTMLAMPVVVIVGAMIAVAIYVDSPGPVIYRSRRVGRDGRVFEMLKFRKMRREADSHPVTLDDDARFTPIGRFLSSTRLDELPQVVNVLRGEMRLVGPRPELEVFVAEFSAAYEEILQVTPGLTGAAQLRFVGEKALLRGPNPELTYTDTVMPEKLAIDLDYVRHHNLPSDLAILARTALLPLGLLLRQLRRQSPVLRLWIPTALCAGVLMAAFIIAASHVP